MRFQSLEVLDKMRQLYQLPRTRERFDKYLYMLQGDVKKDIILPIAAFNPMGKELALQQLEQLIACDAEGKVQHIVAQINPKIPYLENRTIQVAINLVDDVEGAWSNFYDTDYKSKFEIDALLKRNFCTPLFWTSEPISEAMVAQRIQEYIYRTIFWVENGKPQTLQELFKQEVYVKTNGSNERTALNDEAICLMKSYYEKNLESMDYLFNLNYFYGDEGSKDLNYKAYGMIKNGGFEYAKYIANTRREAYNTQF
ncbi:MAG TPA: hypothetical protein PKA00_06480 [Saprospiraceae bacterium]|nr:hypothetical protein [Saprospiraceae bacterium]HMQ82532.1 hypothetical protein [Saprospiraceae bacterium]